MRRTALLLAMLLLAGCAPQSPASGGGASSSPGPSVSTPKPDVSQPEWETVSGVRVDWSKLEDKAKLQPDVDGGRWYPEYTDHLITGANYGPLIPYLGDRAYPFDRWEVEIEGEWVAGEHFSDWPTPFHGLMTRDGKIVVDPVYQNVWPYSYRWEGEDRILPVLILERADPKWEKFGSGSRYAVAAEDGSWMTDHEFLNYTNKEDQLFLLRPEGCTVLDSKTGSRKDWSWKELDMPESGEELEEALSFIQWSVGLTWLDEGICLGQGVPAENETWEKIPVRVFRPETGEVYWVEQGQWDRWYDEYSDRRWGGQENLVHENGGATLTVNGQSYFLKDTYETGMLDIKRGDFAILTEQHAGDNIRTLYRLSTGERGMEETDFDLVVDRAWPESVLPAAYERGAWTVYSDQLEPLLTLPPTSEDKWVSFSLQDGLLTFEDDDSSFFGAYDLDKGAYVFFRNLGLGD